MKRDLYIRLVALLLGVSACAAQGQQSSQTEKPPVHKVKAHPQTIQARRPATAATSPAPEHPAPVPAQATPPPTPEQGPSSPPQVNFQGGQLTIEALNSTMGDVLNAVRQKTGAAVDMPAVSNERVVGRFGPGAPRDVLAQLLNGSHYDYVLLGSPTDPGDLKKIVLMARAAGPEQAASQLANAQQGRRQNQNLQAVPEVDNDQSAPDDSNNEVPAEVQPPEEESQQPDQNLQQQEQPQQSQGGPVVKTPEQLLRELQQQQQQQQQQNPPPQ